jgi:hypothetical protein
MTNMTFRLSDFRTEQLRKAAQLRGSSFTAAGSYSLLVELLKTNSSKFTGGFLLKTNPVYSTDDQLSARALT